MRESSTYQAILEEGREEGRVEGARRLLLRLGTRKLGAPDASTEASLARIDDLDVLERLSDDLLTAASWTDLLRSAS
jgi:predicted transposase YdaD